MACLSDAFIQTTNKPKGRFTWWEGAPANRATRLTELPKNALERLHARQGSLPTRGTLSTCPRHPARRSSFLPYKRIAPRYHG